MSSVDWNIHFLKSPLLTAVGHNFRRSRGETLSQRIRRSIRAKLRPSVFIVSTSFLHVTFIQQKCNIWFGVLGKVQPYVLIQFRGERIVFSGPNTNTIRFQKFGWIRIPILSVFRNMAEYKKWYYSCSEIWPNTNTIRSATLVLIRIQILRVFE